ncbi:MAG TPA: CvpA family protein [Anaerolineales bacterium]|nr:CvpA family protein [Anaerolineales bacterium]
MIALSFAFWVFVIFFAVVGAMRGWAKELLVTFSAVLAIFIVIIMERFVPFITNFGEATDPVTGAPMDFWIRSILMIVFTFFGYQTPRFPRIQTSKLARERVQDVILGALVGALNGYMVIGSLWFFLHQIGYRLNETVANYVFPPDPLTEAGRQALELVAVLPPAILVVPWIYFIIAIAFAFVVIVFV